MPTLMRLALFMIIVIVGGCGPRAESIPMINGRVDDFDDGDRYNSLGYEWEAVSGGREAHATIFIERGGPGESVYQMTVGGMRPFGSTDDQVSGARIGLGSALDIAKMIVTDVTAYDGLQISIKGTPGTFIVQIGTAAITDFDYYNAYVEVTGRWNVYRIPFDRFDQEGFGRSRTWTGNDITHVAIYSTIFGPYTIAVDDIKFYSEINIP